jgi:hypothetical protein
MYRSRLVPVFASLFALVACKSEPQTSYCEALCDWAVSCAEGERDVDAATMRADCIADAEAADPSCSDAADGLGPGDAKLTSDCTDAITAAQDAGECESFTGSIDDLKTGTTPTECATQGTGAQDTFEAVRDSTTESSDELCERFAHTFCSTMGECVEAALGDQISDAIASVGLDPYDKCIEDLQSQTDTCKSESQYAAEEDITDANASRQAARECLGDWEAVTCDDITTGSLPALCAPAVVDPTEYADTLLGVLETYQSAVTR